MLMRHPDNGWHNASSLEVEEMKKNGWIESSNEEYQKVIAAKKMPKKVDNITVVPDSYIKGKPGRKPNIYNDNK